MLGDGVARGQLQIAVECAALRFRRGFRQVLRDVRRDEFALVAKLRGAAPTVNRIREHCAIGARVLTFKHFTRSPLNRRARRLWCANQRGEQRRFDGI